MKTLPKFNPTFAQDGFGAIQNYIEACPESYFITLTSRRTYDQPTLSAQVSKCMHLVNTALFGSAYRKRRRVRLASFWVQEQTINEGWHTHGLIGVPPGALEIKPHPCRTPVPDLILSTWVRLDDHGKRSGQCQDAQEIFFFEGALGYVAKGLNSLRDSDNVDVLNCTIPEEAWLSAAEKSIDKRRTNAEKTKG